MKKIIFLSAVILMTLAVDAQNAQRNDVTLNPGETVTVKASPCTETTAKSKDAPTIRPVQKKKYKAPASASAPGRLTVQEIAFLMSTFAVHRNAAVNDFYQQISVIQNNNESGQAVPKRTVVHHYYDESLSSERSDNPMEIVLITFLVAGLIALLIYLLSHRPKSVTSSTATLSTLPTPPTPGEMKGSGAKLTVRSDGYEIEYPKEEQKVDEKKSSDKTAENSSDQPGSEKQ